MAHTYNVGREGGASEREVREKVCPKALVRKVWGGIMSQKKGEGLGW